MLSEKNKSNLYVVFVIIIVGGYLLFSNLDGFALWQDEAETACVGGTISKESLLPKGFDGVNHFSQQDGKEYGASYVWKLHPWFQFYWAKVSTTIFGNTTFGARFLFALLGLGTIILSYFLSLLLWKDKKTAWFTVLFFCISVTFILMARQARYYSPVFFFSIYSIYGMFAYFKDKKFGLFHFALGSLFLFHSHYLFAIVLWGASVSYAIIYHKAHVKKLILLILVLALPNFFYLKWLLDTPYGEGFKVGLTFSEGISVYSLFILKYLFLPFWLIVPFVFYYYYKHKIKWEEEKPLVFFSILIFFNIIGLLLLGQNAFVRYLCGIVPILIIIKGRFCSWLYRIHIAVPIIAVILVLIFGDFSRYTNEFKQDSGGPITEIVDFLKRKSNKEDKIGIGYGDLPLKFYLPNKVYGGLSGDFPRNLDSLDIIIIRTNAITERDKKVTLELDKYLKEHLDEFSGYGLMSPDLPFECRETPDEHYRNKDFESANISIFVRK